MGKPLKPRSVKCPHCSAQMPETSLKKHIQKKHSGPAEQAGPAAPSKPRATRRQPFFFRQPVVVTYKTCPICQVEVYSVVFDHHLEMHRSQRNAAALRSQTREGLHPLPKTQTEPSEIPDDPSSRAELLEDHLANSEHQGLSQEQWYRDSDGDLWLGPTPESEQERYIVDTGPVDSNQDQKLTSGKPTGRDPSKSIPFPSFALTPSPENRVVCPICRSRVPKSNIRGHLLKHDGMVACPSCGQLMRATSLTYHMDTHPNWCPICRGEARDLKNHLSQVHRLKQAVDESSFYRPSWETQPLFICEQCKEKTSLVNYPFHRRPHGPGPKPVINNPEPPMAPTNKARQPQMTPCPYCQKDVAQISLEFHIEIEHHPCPHCQHRMPLKELKNHIDANHAGKAL